MTLVDGVEVPWDLALQQAVDALNPAPPGFQIVSVAVEGSNLVTTLEDGTTNEIPGVHLFGDPVDWVDNFDGTATLYTGPKVYSVRVNFSEGVPANPPQDPSVSQMFGLGDELFDHFGIIAFANFEIRFGVTIRTAAIVFESDSARDDFNYGFDLSTWSLAGVSLKTEYDPGNTGWSHTRVPIDGVQKPAIQLTDPPADKNIVDLFAPGASHLLDWAPAGSWVEDELARVTELIRVTKEAGDWPAVGAGSWVPGLSLALMHNPEWTKEELQEQAQLNVASVGVASQPLLQDVLDSGMWEPPNLFYTIILTGTRDWEGAIGLLYKTDRFIKNQL